MCKYCKNVKTGDNWEDLFCFPIDIKIGKSTAPFLEFAGGISSDGKFAISINGYEGCTEYGAKKIPISYCPMCGSNLKDLCEGSDI